MKILMIDNYDSFTYNLVQYVERLTGRSVTVRRNDKISIDEVADFDKIMLSPGPGIPDEAGISKEVVRIYGHEKSILGVCLGHQAIGEVYGGRLVNMNKVYHGIATAVHVTAKDEPLFREIPEIFDAGRYHSWMVSKDGFPDCLEITAVDDEGTIMGLRHRKHNVRGVQFHPESVLTKPGMQIITNWLLL